MMGVTLQGYRARTKRLYSTPLARAQEKTAELPALALPTAFGQKAHDNLRKIQTQKLDPLAKTLYKQRLNKLWLGASKYYPATHGKQPPSSFTKSPDHPFAAEVDSSTPRGRRPVKYNVTTARQYAANPAGSPQSNYTVGTPLHEWSHVIQRRIPPQADPLLSNNKQWAEGLRVQNVRVEGGADSYARRVTHKLGLPEYRGGYPEYEEPFAFGIDRNPDSTAAKSRQRLKKAAVPRKTKS